MDLNVTSNFPDINVLRHARTARSYAPVQQQPAPQDEIRENLPALIGKNANNNNTATKLVSETHEPLDYGYRRTSTFERADGRTFTRMEELVLTDQGARRQVIQQNPSGNVTRYEEILDRESGGNFRRTQRFQDEAGDITTQITEGFKVTNPFVLTNGASQVSSAMNAPFASYRGTQLDLSA